MSKTGMDFLSGITLGTQKGPKIIVKVVIAPFKGPKLPFIMCWLDLQRSKKLIISIVII